MEPITLDEMDSIRLMNRVDTKFMTDEAGLLEFLRRAAGKYRVFEIGGQRTSGYDTVYYDTPDLRMYMDHHNRRLTRKKVRVRTYLSNDETFLEIKRKDNHGRTKKKRIHCSGSDVFGPEQTEFLMAKSGYSPSEIAPKLRTSFERITLVNLGKTERLTIDTSLLFENLASGRSASMGSGVIIELKQDGAAPSPCREIFSEMRIHPFKVSKYCIGTAATSPSPKKNRFKGKIRKIEKIINNSLSI